MEFEVAETQLRRLRNNSLVRRMVKEAYSSLRFRRDLYRKYMAEGDTYAAQMVKNNAIAELQEHPARNYVPEIWARFQQRFDEWF